MDRTQLQEVMEQLANRTDTELNVNSCHGDHVHVMEPNQLLQGRLIRELLDVKRSLHAGLEDSL